MNTKILVLSTALLAATGLWSGSVVAETKIGMITTLSGGGAGLGIDIRDGFMLAMEQSGRRDVGGHG